MTCVQVITLISYYLLFSSICFITLTRFRISEDKDYDEKDFELSMFISFFPCLNVCAFIIVVYFLIKSLRGESSV